MIEYFKIDTSSSRRLHDILFHCLANCPDGYEEKHGDIKGAATLKTFKDTNLAECLKLCNEKPECHSFEYCGEECSSHIYHCNLNRESLPDNKRYQNFTFCAKRKLIVVISNINTKKTL